MIVNRCHPNTLIPGGAGINPALLCISEDQEYYQNSFKLDQNIANSAATRHAVILSGHSTKRE